MSNTTGRPMNDWYIQWLLPQGATITQAWKGTHMQSGPIAMIHAPADDPVLAPGATVSGIGFVGAAATPPAFTEITCG
ncbi:cellulose binding domain-containing protein [Planomonospora venezuelensis]|uniref:cellulose binding domain-containing protein n=1 Tax=Planomonospora venezuelensis TaxID=1999 RepID=UPI0031EF183A